ncbi:MAG TPA: Sec-dependent nitrous-oxide reductase [Candidatus Limnocylindria bacterium]|nr:Sec-dependent nitrous-oxide reductase [Candidatus Limnocylindria bacterium]
MQRYLTPATVAVAVVALVVGVAGGALIGRFSGGLGGGALGDIAARRGMTADEAAGALSSFVAPGKYDEYALIASGGHSGQLHIVGVPSLRLLKTIPVFSPESWSGYGVGADSGEKVLGPGSDPRKQAVPLTWGDTHHPALSETNGEYDGRFVYINDRANGRLGVVDLRDFKTKQILDIPNMGTSHGGVFTTPNSEYVHLSSMTPTPQTADGYAPLERYKDLYRGISTFVKVDPTTGRGDLAKSFQIELPPYTQDLADAGKKASFGFAFINSYNSEMAVGTADGGKPLEVGASKNDFDLMHIIDWQRAEQVAAAGKTETRNGVRVITLRTAIDEGILYFTPEPRSPHGVDVSPDGNYIVVGGKLDPHATIYDIALIKKAIAEKAFAGTDPFGVPILKFDAVVAGQVELGAGPLHTQFDGKGNAFTSLFLDSAVAKFSLGPKAGIAQERAFKLLEKVSVHYNIGHLASSEGDTVAADGKYLVALNKWSVDRHPLVGTLNPQNFQLIDIQNGAMKVINESPIGFGEPHYAQIVRMDRLSKAIEAYRPGSDPLTFQPSAVATAVGKERVERTGTTVTVYMTAMRSHFTPDVIRVKKGDTVRFHITNIETTRDATHGFAVPGYNVNASLDPGEVVTIELTASKTGAFAFYCTEFCSALHLEMQGWLLVEPQ